MRLAEPAATPAQVPLLWRDALPERVLVAHEQDDPRPDLAVYVLPESIVVDRGWILHGGAPIWSADLFPVYLRYYLRHGWTTPDLSLERREPIAVDRCWTIWHFNCDTYGHWLLEGLPKLLTIRRCLDSHPDLSDVPLVLPATVSRAVRQAVDFLTPGLATLDYDPDHQYVSARRLLLPTWGREYFHHPLVSRLLDDAIGAASPGAGSSRIFVSRRSVSVVRQLRNLAALASIAEDHGFEVVYPEERALREQVGMFSRARAVVGEFGSALHNTLFSRRGTAVLALNWVNALQSRIGQLRGLRVGYLMPADGRPVLFQRDRVTPQSYEISEIAFAKRIADLLRAVDGD